MRTVQFELLRPDEIVAERERVPLVYVPLGPLEWHSLHMPVGTDALNAQGVARRAAERTGGVVMPTFFWGTERERPPDMVRDIGFNEDDYIVGMDFPKNILKSLYCREEFLALLVRELLNLLIRLEYQLIVLVNGHGALNQIETLQRLAKEFTACSPAQVLFTIAFPVNFGFRFGIGHADAAEVSVMMAMHPDSVDLSTLPPLPEPLNNVDWAIVDSDTFRGHPSPDHTLSDEADPRRHASAEQGHRMIEQTVAEIEQIVWEALTELGYPSASGVAE